MFGRGIRHAVECPALLAGERHWTDCSPCKNREILRSQVVCDNPGADPPERDGRGPVGSTRTKDTVHFLKKNLERSMHLSHDSFFFSIFFFCGSLSILVC